MGKLKVTKQQITLTPSSRNRFGHRRCAPSPGPAPLASQQLDNRVAENVHMPASAEPIPAETGSSRR
jgi:hypothetical protein